MRYFYLIIILILMAFSASLIAENVDNLSKVEASIKSIHLDNHEVSDIAAEEMPSPMKVFDNMDILSDCTFEVDLRGRSDVTNCNNPNGKLTIGARFGDVKVALNNDWSTEWYDSDGNKLKFTHKEASNLDIGTYTVHLYHKVTNCTATATFTVGVSLPNLSGQTITHVIDCNTNTSHIRLTLSGDFPPTDKYEVKLYGGPNESYPIIKTISGSSGLVDNTYGLAPGSYVATIGGTGGNNCVSKPVEITINDERIYPVVTIGPPVNNTNCAPNAPNGSLTASVTGGNAGHKFEWFSGQNTIGPPVSTNATATSLASGTYTVRVTNTATNCSSTAEGIVGSTIVRPTVTASKTSDYSNCNAPDGSATASVGGVTAGYNFNWYVGGAITTTPAYTGHTYSGLINGPYTVTATNTSTGCVSDPVTVNILDARVIPAINLTPTPNTNCSPAAPNGAITISIAGGNTGYTFEWFTGGLPITGSPVTNPSNLASGQYAVRVTRTATGCSATATTSVENIPLTPVINFTSQNQTACSPLNGSITINSITEGENSVALSNYTISLINSSGTPTSGTNGVFTALPAGTYSLQAENNTSRCRSVVSSISIANNTVLPEISIARVANSNCSPAAANGSLTASATTGGVAASGGYTYTWYDGGLPISGPSIGNNNLLSGLAAGTYAVEVMDITSGCTSRVSAVVEDAVYTPVITYDITHQSYCNPNGTVNITAVRENRVVIPSGEYTFVLTGPNGVAAADASGTFYPDLVAGAYTLQAEHNVRSCRSALLNFNVALTTILPTVALTTVNNGSCNAAAPNGSITASASTSADAPGTVYTYEWFNGGLPIAVNASAVHTGTTYSNLGAGTYSVRATNTTTGCFRDATTNIIDQAVLPVATFTTTPETYCSPNGTISIVGDIEEDGIVVSPLSEYNITLTHPGGATVTQTADNSFTGLAGGNYSVRIQHSVRLCKSVSQTVTVDQAIVYPVITRTISPQESCDLSTPNGSITVEADGEKGAPYVFEWFNGGLPVAPGATILHTGNELTGLNPGTYSIRLTNTTTGCVVYNSYTVEENIIIPVVTTIADELTSCFFPDGEIIATLQTGLDVSDYYFYLYEGKDIKAIPDRIGNPTVGDVEMVFDNLPIGDYRIVAEHKTNKCRSTDPNTISIAEDDDTKIKSTQEAFPASCDSDGGALEVKATSGVNSIATGGAGYDFNWYEGTVDDLGDELIIADATHPNLLITTTNFDSKLEGVIQGYYTVKVFNRETGCEVWDTEFLPYKEAHEVLLTATNATSCVDFTNTQITVQIDPNIPFVGSNFPASDFIFTLFEGEYAIGTPLETIDGNDFIGGFHTFTGYEPGDYTVVATMKAAPYCPSEPETVTIGTSVRDPLITPNVVENTQCGPYTGVIEISVAPHPDDDQTSTYTFDWKDQNGLDVNHLFVNTSSTSISHNTSTSSPQVLPPGIYTVTIFNTVTQCESEASYTVGNNPPDIELDVTPTPQIQCNPEGTIAITEVREDNIAVPLSGYNYILYDIGFNELARSVDIANFETIDNFTFTNLAAGAYYIQATNKISGCSKPSTLTFIDETIVYPALTLVDTDPDESCPGGTPTGALSAEADGFDHTNTDYTFSWYDGNNNPIGNNESSISGLGNGYYKLVVENINTGCSESAEYFVPFFDTQIEVFAVPTPSAVCFDDGSVIFSVEKDGINEADLSGYTFELTYPDLTTGILMNNPSGLAPGDYYVTVTHNSLFCVSDMVHFEIRDESANPAIEVLNSEPDMSCDQDNPTGILAISKIDGIDIDGSSDLSNFNINWYSNDDLATSIGTDYNLINAATGTYTVSVYNITTQCTGTAELDIQSLPANIEISATSQNTTKCAPFNGTAAISGVTLNGIAEADFSNFTFTWIDQATSTTGTISSWTDLDPGMYYVSAYHTTLHCTSNTVEITIEDDSVNPVVIVEQTAFDVRCDDSKNPTGRLNIVSIDTENTDFSNYSINWYSNADLTTSIGTDRFIEDQPAGWYTVVVVNDAVGGSDCTGSAEFYLAPQPSVIAITDVDPIHVIRCTSVFDGEAVVTAIHRNGIAEPNLNDYSFEWFNSSYASIGTGASIDELAHGTYYVMALHNDLGCFSNYFEVIIEDQSSLPVIAMDPSAPNISCNPSSPTGSLSASIPGVSDYSDYTFTWYNINDLNNPIAADPADQKRIINQSAGTYTVYVYRGATGCTASLSGFIEDNLELGKPLFSLSSQNTIDCTDSGEIEILAVTGYDLNDYTFKWFKEPYNASAPFHTGTELSRTGLGVGIYYIEAEDILYGCTTIIQTEIFDGSVNPDIQFNYDAAEQNNCRPGILTGQVIAEVDGYNDATQNTLYNFTWYNGKSTLDESNRRSETGYFISNLDSGYYSVTVLDVNTGCTSHGTYYVRDARPYPNIEVEIIANKNCDPTRTNGEFYADADGENENHTFEWYVGEYYTFNDIDPASKFSEEAHVTNLSSQWYTVVVRNIYSECRSLLPVFMMDSLELIPAPEAIPLAHVDNCTSSNGMVTASVNGNTDDYTFDWYSGEAATEISYSGVTFEGIAPGIYSVTATEIATGCVSERAFVEVEDHTVYPKFTIKTKNSICLEDNGTVTIIVEPGTDIESIILQSGPNQFHGSFIENLALGEYPVTVTTTSGCSTTAIASVGLDITVYNGISPNNDGQNDFFIVDCLQDYPNNIVKIFNRAGALVYEATGYDNKNIYFDGVGNRGIYIDKNNVPDGTYFYIVDKRDGSNPKSGYLELSR